MTADERIIALVKPEYMEQIPSFVRKHATERTCELIAREFPEIYEIFSKEEEPEDEAKKQMSLIVNDIFTERLNKHHLLQEQ